ncbi:MAG: aromatic-ring-hydroxylating dioxygenase subunit beta [Alphaproteobacteria bacterium]|nr:aromatic-ring-hydroxylating dioxygenase subunit beta [Alphaproteobacteria bacterium]
MSAVPPAAPLAAFDVPREVRDAVGDLLAAYGLLIDEDKLEDWVALFDDACDYKVVTRENVEQGLPNVLIWCDNKDMLSDRVHSYRHVNEYNLHWDRHVIGPPRFLGQQDGAWRFEASYALFQTDLEGASRLFSVGRYRMAASVASGAARLRSVEVVADTGLVPSLLATPI